MCAFFSLDNQSAEASHVPEVCDQGVGKRKMQRLPQNARCA